MISDYFGVFGWISGKRDEISKSRHFRGPTPRRRDPTQRRGREGGLGKPRVHQGITLFTKMCFCHVLLFHYSEDLSIGLMRTL